MTSELKACPFCGNVLTRAGGCNPYGRCDTDGCWMNERKVVVVMDDPRQVAAWNTRHPAPLSEENVEVVARAWAEPFRAEIIESIARASDEEVARLQMAALKDGEVVTTGEVRAVLTALSTTQESNRE